MDENLAQVILNEIKKMSIQVNSMQENMNNLQTTVSNMQSQITELSIGQVKLSEKIDRVEQNLKAEIEEVRSELKAEIEEVRSELKAEIAEVRSELKAEIAEVRSELKTEIAELRSELRDVREIAEFTQETCITIVNTFDREYKTDKANINKINTANLENKKYILNHEKRICKLEGKKIS